MKATILIGVFAAVFFTGAVYFSAGSTYAVYTAVVCSCLVIAMIRQVLFIDKQRKRWKAAPIPPDIKKFDVFSGTCLFHSKTGTLKTSTQKMTSKI